MIRFSPSIFRITRHFYSQNALKKLPVVVTSITATHGDPNHDTHELGPLVPANQHLPDFGGKYVSLPHDDYDPLKEMKKDIADLKAQIADLSLLQKPVALLLAYQAFTDCQWMVLIKFFHDNPVFMSKFKTNPKLIDVTRHYKKLQTETNLDPDEKAFMQCYENMQSQFGPAIDVDPTLLKELSKKRNTSGQPDLSIYDLPNLERIILHNTLLSPQYQPLLQLIVDFIKFLTKSQTLKMKS